MSSLTNALFRSSPPYIKWKIVPLGVYRLTHALWERAGGGGELPRLVQSVCTSLHGKGLLDLPS